MRSLKLFGLVILLLLLAYPAASLSLFLTFVLVVAAGIVFLWALIVNHGEHTGAAESRRRR